MADRLQERIEKLAKARKYWRELANGIGDSTGSPVVVGLTARIQSKADQLLEELKVCDPTNGIAIAKIQAGYAVCENILLDFDINTCNKQIADLDIQLKAAADEIDKKSEKKKNPGVGGFEHLIVKK